MGDPSFHPDPRPYQGIIVEVAAVSVPPGTCKRCRGWGDIVDINAPIGEMRKTCPFCSGSGEVAA